jgi:hypothetical protein
LKIQASRFPDQESLLLPTAFGNTLRSFEIYPRMMYGMESIDGWSRILAVVQKDYLALIDSAKAQVDFWINTGFLSIVVLIQIVALWLLKRSLPPFWLAGAIILIAAISSWLAVRSAGEWGDYVKSVFDLYRFNLLDAFGIKRPETRQEEKKLWTAFSQAIIYRMPDILPELKKSHDSEKNKTKAAEC